MSTASSLHAPLSFTVVKASSEENGFEAASAFAVYSPTGNGWQSNVNDKSDAKTLVLKVQHNDTEHIVHALEIVGHEKFIPEKIEISLGIYDGEAPASFDQCTSICNLGYITLDSNERSGYLSREQKYIPINKRADLVQLVLKGCHKNVHNIHSKVGIVGIRVMAIGTTSMPTVTKTIETPSAIPIATVLTNTIIETPSVVSAAVIAKTVEVPVVTPVSSLPPHVKNDLDAKTLSSITRLERLKMERASLEDFSMAGKIKESLGIVYALFIAFKTCEKHMREAAASEEYVLASELKSERNMKREQATLALQEVEKQFFGSDRLMNEPLIGASTKDETLIRHTIPSSTRPTIPSTPQSLTRLSPARSMIETAGAASHLMKNTGSSGRTIEQQAAPLRYVDSKLLERTDEILAPPTPSSSAMSSMRDEISISTSRSKKSSVETGNRASITNEEEVSNNYVDSTGYDEHPLLGVEKAEALPVPEVMSAVAGNASSDLLLKSDDLFGEYRVRCLFSKNWALRDAALAKITLLSSDICSRTNGDCAEVMLKIVETGICDINMQVYLASLVLLDETILQFESLSLQDKLTPHLPRITNILLDKLADSNRKIAESAELALISLTSSSCDNDAFIIKAATEKVRVNVKARLSFLESLVAEFGNGLSWKRIIHFVVTNKAFEHKDGGVRDAVKSLIVTLMAVSKLFF
jgi:hypothetical protein